MRNKWYSDNRDLVKWSVLLILAEKYQCTRILQIACFIPSEYGTIEIDGQEHEIPPEVLLHFRDIRKIQSMTSHPQISVLDSVFENRKSYFESVKKYIASFSGDRCVVFLDPDTGLEPAGKSCFKHILNEEVRSIWNDLPADWLLVFYQHQTNRSGNPWIEDKRKQFANAISVPLGEVKVASGMKIASDVVFFYVLKSDMKNPKKL